MMSGARPVRRSILLRRGYGGQVRSTPTAWARSSKLEYSPDSSWDCQQCPLAMASMSVRVAQQRPQLIGFDRTTHPGFYRLM